MTVILKNKPPVAQLGTAFRRAGFEHGDALEIKVSRKKVTIIPTPADHDDTVLTPGEAELIRKAEHEMKQGKYVTLNQLRHDLDRPRSRRRTKTA